MPTQMSRRELIAWLAATAGAGAAGASVLLNGSSPTATSPAPTTPDSGSTEATGESGAPTSTTTERTAPIGAPQIDGEALLVVIEMAGGNDGLSMAVPYAQGRYYDLREQTAIAQADVLTIDDDIGLHPELTRLHTRGVTLVEGVGDVGPDGSHFEMSARWWAGRSGRDDTGTGWIGRLNDVLDDGSSPATALSVGSGSHAIVRSNRGSGLSLPGADSVYALVGADPDDQFRNAYQAAVHGLAQSTGGTSPIDSIRGMLGGTIDFAGKLIETDDDDGDDSESRRERLGYTYSGLSNSLQFAATVFSGDAGIRVIHVTMDGDFDTHDDHVWRHPALMADLDASVSAFHDDLAERGLAERVMVMTTSEFGRTLSENSSGGLDHGTASIALLSGPGLGGRRGEMPSFTALDDNGDLRATVPIEAYLGGVVEGWLGVPSSEVFGPGEPLQLF